MQTEYIHAAASLVMEVEDENRIAPILIFVCFLFGAGGWPLALWQRAAPLPMDATFDRARTVRSAESSRGLETSWSNSSIMASIDRASAPILIFVCCLCKKQLTE